MPINRIKGEGDDLVDVEEIVASMDIHGKKAAVTASAMIGRITASLWREMYFNRPRVHGLSKDTYMQQVMNFNLGFNGTSWDLWENNLEGTLLASAARTVTLYSAEQTNFNHKGIYLFINVSAIVTAPSLTIRLLMKDSISGLFSAFTAYTPAITAVGTYVIALHPGLVDTAGTFCLACDAMLPRTWKLHVVHANTDSITYSISYQSIV